MDIRIRRSRQRPIFRSYHGHHRAAAALSCWLLVLAIAGGVVHGHPRSLHRFLKSRQAAEEQAATDSISVVQSEPSNGEGEPLETCQLTIRLIDAQSGRPLPASVRITLLDMDKRVQLDGPILRDNHWWSVPADVTVAVPGGRVKIEAIHGLESELAEQIVDLTGKATATTEVRLHRFYDAHRRGLRSGNTHLHLMRMTHGEAYRYLQLVPKADDLDLVFLSHLRRLPDERHYISNLFTDGDLQRLSREGVLFGNGQEHRHNFGRGGEGYGHVMLLNLLKLIRPVSIGPGIMGSGTDGRPLQRGIQQARDDGATVIWCHNTFGFEDIPNWMAGLLDAQNIFDGGTHGSYQDTFYRYLNLGMTVPFSTGTDWFIYDFSRVYLPVDGELTVKKWLAALAEGRSYITNGTFLELTADGRAIGDTLALERPATVEIVARGVGRSDFRALELVHNGQVIHTQPSRRTGGHFVAQMKFSLDVRQAGWLALRIPLDAGKNEFDRWLYAHTSPIYVEWSGRRIFRREIAQQLIAEIEQAVEVIQSKGRFADERERQEVLAVYREGIQALRRRIEQAAAAP